MDIVFGFVLALAVVYDLREQRIPNALTVGGLVSALMLRFVMDPELALGGLLGAGAGLLIAVVFFATGSFGAGDGKLLVAVGAFLGPEGLPAALAATAIAGGLTVIYVSYRGGMFIPVLLQSKDLAVWCVTLGRAGERRSLSEGARLTIPYAPSIAFGALLAWAMGGGLP